MNSLLLVALAAASLFGAVATVRWTEEQRVRVEAPPHQVVADFRAR